MSVSLDLIFILFKLISRAKIWFLARLEIKLHYLCRSLTLKHT